MTEEIAGSQNRGSIFYRITIVAFVILGIGIAAAAGTVRPSVVAVGSTTHDFGETHSGQHLKCTLTLRNPHPYSESVYPLPHQMCGCMKVTVNPPVVAPHAEAVATLEMDPHDVDMTTHASQIIPIGVERFGKKSVLWVTLNYVMLAPPPSKSAWHGPSKGTHVPPHPPSPQGPALLRLAPSHARARQFTRFSLGRRGGTVGAADAL
jgi:hypothetical protein